MTVSATTPSGDSIPALLYRGSVIVATSGSSLSIDCVAAKAVTVTVLADTWLRVGFGSVSADGQDGCDILPAGCKWTERLPDSNSRAIPHATVALATVDGSISIAVVRFAAE